jgi:hypothetical protein
MKRLKKVCDGASRFYGNGTVYLASGSEVIELSDHNFDIESLGPDGAEVWMCDGVAVCLSPCSKPEEAMEELRRIIQRIQLATQLTKNE